MGVKKRVLVVEDNLLFRRFLENILPKHLDSFDFMFAGSARSAKQSIEKLSELHCLVTDYNLGAGQANGIQLAEEIRRDFPNINIILISSYMADSLRLEAKHHGIYNCAAKLDGLYQWIKFIET